MPLNILSLGAGVQSSTVLLMSCKGILPKLDAAVFADTCWEPDEVYIHLKWLTEEAERHNIPVYTVSQGDLRKHCLEGRLRDTVGDGYRNVSIPAFVIGQDGSKGMIRRQCTSEYKVRPIEKFMRRSIVGIKRYGKAKPNMVNQWFGISCDELKRVRISKTFWINNIYPLCNLPDEMLPKPYTRQMCLEWLKENYPDRHVPRSACIGCPFHSKEEWLKIKNNPKYWNDAVEVDEAIRKNSSMNGEMFLHRSRIPLKDVDFGNSQVNEKENGFNDECLGYCGN